MSQNRLHNLDLSTLRSFVTIADSGSMTRAAGRLFMTQSAISMQIKRLEQSLGLSVFDRSSQGMTTTTEGEQLLHFANQMLAINDEAMGRLTSPDYEGQVRLGVPCDIIYPHIPWVLKDFSRDYPRVQIKLSSGSTLDLKHQFNQGLQDVVLTTEREASPGGHILATQSLVWTGAVDGVAWKQQPVPLGISKNSLFRASATKALEDARLDWVDIVASADDIAALAMVSADLCISTELESVKNPSRVTIEHGGQLPALPRFSIMLYSSDTQDNNLVAALVDYLLRVSN
ncbi:MAG: LysR family transcriptional regulator [Gammaproteobacteria bacterium]|nr:LysR family transcriptional regulator [Gammaproteobacteria bacterium]